MTGSLLTCEVHANVWIALVPAEWEQGVFCPVRLQAITTPVKPQSASKNSQN